MVIALGSASERYGGLYGDDGSARRDGQAQNGGTKTVWARHKKGANQQLTSFGPTTSLFSFLAHVGGCAVWWGWMS